MELDSKKKRKNNYNLEKNLIFKLLQKLVYGRLTIIDANGMHDFGELTEANDFHVTIKVNNGSFYRALLLNGSNGAAKSYIDGEWEVNDLINLIEIAIKNEPIFSGLDNGMAKIKNFFAAFSSKIYSNRKERAKKNISAHYDLGNEFFAFFLDPMRMYSSAVYPNPSSSLTEASIHKLNIISEKLNLTSNDHVLEIGTGWGGLAIFLAKKYQCKVTTTTISEQQYIYVKNQIAALGLDDKINLLKKDYRDLTGQYDKLVSIEMIEAVGHEYFDAFFKQCNALLKPGGLMFLQAIVINDQNYEKAKNQIDFIKKYIFPGGCLPSIYTINRSILRHTNLQLLYLNDIGEHYARTLLDWKNNFQINVDGIRKLGFSDEFIRMWEYYICYCTAAFNQKYIGNIQSLWRKRI